MWIVHDFFTANIDDAFTYIKFLGSSVNTNSFQNFFYIRDLVDTGTDSFRTTSKDYSSD